MGLFDNLFKAKPLPADDAVVEAARRTVELEQARLREAEAAEAKIPKSTPPARTAHAPVARAYSPRSLGNVVAPQRPSGTGKPGEKKIKLSAAGIKTPGEIRLILGDVLPRIPPDLLNDQPRDPKRELRFLVADVTSDIARGRAEVHLSRIAEQVPEIFRAPITNETEALIRLPLQKLVEQIGFGVSPRPDASALPPPPVIPSLPPPPVEPPVLVRSETLPQPAPETPPVPATEPMFFARREPAAERSDTPEAPGPLAAGIPRDAKVSLPLAAVLKNVPKEMIVSKLPPITDEDRLVLPFGPLEKQLESGEVNISAVRFVFSLPAHLQSCFDARDGSRIPLPIDDIYAALADLSAAPAKSEVSTKEFEVVMEDRKEAARVPETPPELMEIFGRKKKAPVPAPVSEIVAPVSEIVAPVSEIVAPVSEIVAPVPEIAAPVSEIAAPVSEIAAPVSEIAAPVSEIAVPVSEIAVPVSEIAVPVSEIAVPVSEIVVPVSEIAVPVSEIAVPVPESPAPVLEIAAPIFKVPAPALEIPAPVEKVAEVVISSPEPKVTKVSPPTPIEEDDEEIPTVIFSGPHRIAPPPIRPAAEIEKTEPSIFPEPPGFPMQPPAALTPPVHELEEELPPVAPPPSPILPVRMVTPLAVRPFVAPPPLFGGGSVEVPIFTTEPEPEPEPVAPPPPPPPPPPLELAPATALLGLDADAPLVRIGEKLARLPGLHACLLAVRHETADAGALPESFDAAAARVLAARLAAALNGEGESALGEVQHVTVFAADGCLSVFARGGALVCALHKTRAFLPGVREMLGAAAGALAKA